MVELVAKSPCAGMLPIKIGKLELVEADCGVLTSILPFAGRLKPLAQALTSAHDVNLPGANQMVVGEKARAIWFGEDHLLLLGPEPDADLSKHAAISDQSDAWTCVELMGPGAENALSRLVPIDLRASMFKDNDTARTLIQHMNGSVTRLSADRFLLLVFRSMAATLVHDLKEAMESVAARD